MVGFDPGSGKRLSQTEYALAGAGAGVVTRFICQPLDVLKIRFQIQHETRSGQVRPKYTGLLQAVDTIRREEGVGAFWKGHVPAQLLSFTYGAVQFTSFELFTKLAYVMRSPGSTGSSRKNGHVLHFICGVCAGLTATTVSFPLDLMRTCLVAQGEPKVHSSMFAVGLVIMRKRGFRGFFQGLTPAAVQIAPYAGFQFGFYSFFSNLIMRQEEGADRKASVLGSLSSGALSGIAAKTLVYPLDVTKKRLQMQNMEEIRASHFGKLRKYRNLTDCMQSVLRNEGLAGLYKGYAASLWKAALSSGLHFCIYEQICNAFQTYR